MEFHLQTLSVLFLLLWFQSLGAQSDSNSPQALDALLQDHAYKAFVNPRTGVAYDGTVPSNLTGISISGMRLKCGSLRTRGVKNYKEFEIPIGVIVQPYVQRLILVYQNLGNFSKVYYPLSGYTYLSPVLGLLAYEASNLSATNLPELDIRASINPILIHFSNVKSLPYGLATKCVWFNLQGTVNFSKVVSENTCSTFQQGHFALVVDETAPSPSPAPESQAPAPTPRKKKNNKFWIIGGLVVGGVLLLLLLGLFIAWLKKYQNRKKMQSMERASEVGETLRMTSVGGAKAPAATVTRTQPNLETEYAP